MSEVTDVDNTVDIHKLYSYTNNNFLGMTQSHPMKLVLHSNFEPAFTCSFAFNTLEE